MSSRTTKMARTKSVDKTAPIAKCTACRAVIKSTFEASLHPLLLVLICRKCYRDYGNGDFSLLNDPDTGPGVDEQGVDNYCRWCVDGGDLLICASGEINDPDSCRFAFCRKCIKKNVPNDEILGPKAKEKDLKWNCFACDPDKLKAKRKEAQDIIKLMSEKELKRPALKANNLIAVPREQVTPASDFNIKDLELKNRLDSYKKITHSCSDEVKSKIDTIIEMFLAKDLQNKSLIKNKINDIQIPFREFASMVKDLEKMAEEL